MKKKLLFFSILLLSIVNSNSQNASNGLNRIMDGVREAYELDGISVAVIETERIFYGISGIPNTILSDTAILKSKIHLGSLSKTITSFVAMKMVEDGVLSLQDKVGAVIPELSGIGNSNSISLEDLLKNTSEVNNFNKEKDFKKVINLSGSASVKMLEIAKVALDKKGDDDEFSNAAYVIAALMIERAAKAPFDELVRKVVEDDLKLSCYTTLPDKNGLTNFWGSWADSSAQIAHFATNSFLNNDYMMPADGISMDIVDYSKFLQMQLNGILGDSNYLNYSTYNKIHFENEGFGLGWKNADENGYRVSFHDNQSNSYFFHSVIIPNYKIAVIVMAQLKDASAVDGVYELTNKLVSNYTK